VPRGWSPGTAEGRCGASRPTVSRRSGRRGHPGGWQRIILCRR
jgi:hypothetical protein